MKMAQLLLSRYSCLFIVLTILSYGLNVCAECSTDDATIAQSCSAMAARADQGMEPRERCGALRETLTCFESLSQDCRHRNRNKLRELAAVFVASCEGQGMVDMYEACGYWKLPNEDSQELEDHPDGVDTDPKESDQPSVGYRVAVLGDRGVGKASLISRFLQRELPKFYNQSLDDLYRKKCVMENGDVVLLDIFTGDHDYTDFLSRAIDTADAFILVLAVDDRSSFNVIRYLRDRIISAKGNDALIVVVANKSDVMPEERGMSSMFMKSLCKLDWKVRYVEASAYKNVNTERAFIESINMCTAANRAARDEERRPSIAPEMSAGASAGSICVLSMTALLLVQYLW